MIWIFIHVIAQLTIEYSTFSNHRSARLIGCDEGVLAAMIHPDANRVLMLVDHVRLRGGAPLLFGGWGVDLLVGESVRLHKDVDLIVRLAELGRLEAALSALGGHAVRRYPSGCSIWAAAGLCVDVLPVVPAPGGGLRPAWRPHGQPWPAGLQTVTWLRRDLGSYPLVSASAHLFRKWADKRAPAADPDTGRLAALLGSERAAAIRSLALKPRCEAL